MLQEINQFFILNPIFFWILTLILFGIRPIIPIITGKNSIMIRGDFTEEESEYSEGKRNHNIVLASFTLVALALMFTSSTEDKPFNFDSFLFLSVSTFVFFVSTYLFDLGWNRWVVTIADSGEYGGIILVGAGLYYLATSLYQEPLIALAYLLFLGTIFIITIIDAIKRYKAMSFK